MINVDQWWSMDITWTPHGSNFAVWSIPWLSFLRFSGFHMISHAFTCFHMLSHAFTGNSFPFLMQAQNCITMHNYSLWLSICFMGAASNLTVCCQGAESWFDRRLPTCAGPSSDRFVFWRSSGHCSRGGDRMQSESVRCLKMSKNV